MRKYNTPHRRRVIKTRLTEEEYAEFSERVTLCKMSQSEYIRQLDVDRGVHIVVEVAQIFKGGRAVVRLGKLVIGIGELNALGERTRVQPANAVLIHDLVGDTKCAQ